MKGLAWDDRRLGRLAGLLLSLAAAAESAGARAFPVRFVALAILARAELIASAFVLDAARAALGRRGTATRLHWWVAAMEESLPAPCGRPDDAALLALRLRVLATIVIALVEDFSASNRIDRPLPRRARGGPLPAPRQMMAAMARPGAPLPADTS